jgi:phage baseplate assembly protein W
MSKGKYININFPFKDSDKGFFLDLNSEDTRAIKADLMHLILTRKGERLYMPDFGTNLLKYIFQPNDSITHGEITQEISQTVKKYLPNLQVNKVTVDQSEQNEYVASVRIDYTVTEDVFTSTDFVIINI